MIFNLKILSRKRTNELVKDNIHAENVDVNVSNWLRDEFSCSSKTTSASTLDTNHTIPITDVSPSHRIVPGRCLCTNTPTRRYGRTGPSPTPNPKQPTASAVSGWSLPHTTSTLVIRNRLHMPSAPTTTMQ